MRPALPNSRLGSPAALRGQALSEVREASRILVGPAARRAREGDRAASLLRAHDPGVVWHYWEWNRVRLLATHRARQLGLEHALWDERAGQVAALATQRGLQQELAALKVSRVLARDGIRAVVLKGSGLAQRLYGDPALRDPSTDVDVLVAASNLPRASELLRDHGWTDTLEALTQGDLPELHFAFLGSNGMPPVELHWRMQWYDRFSHTDYVLSRAEEFDGVLRPAAADLPHLLLLFWLRDGFHGLRLAADWAAAIDLVETAATQESAGDAGAAADDGSLTMPPIEALAGPLATARAAAAAAFGEGSAADDHASRRVRAAQRLARTDAERSARQVYTQLTLADLLAGRGPHWRRSLATRWFRDGASVGIEHPGVAPWLVTPARAVSFGRTATGSARLLLLRS